MKSISTQLRRRAQRTGRSWLNRRRDPRYTFVIFGAALIFTLCFLQVRSAGLFDSIEKPVFGLFNGLPQSWFDVMYAVTQMGGLGSLFIWIALAWYLVNRRAAGTLVATGVSAWALAKVAKVAAHRGRPSDILTNTHVFNGEVLGGFGFPSGHATFSAACATILYYQVAHRYRKYLLLIPLLVGVSRMYLGAHFPLDIVGGWALGALVGGAASLLFGSSTKGVSATKLKRFLQKKGMDVQSLQFANVDARGSQPLYITTTKGREYFGKLFGKQEHAADWLFKLFRFFRYKNLQAEEPHLSSRRNVEIEAFAMLWAKQAGVRVAKVVDIIKYGSYWLSIQEKADAIPLSEHKRLQQKSLIDAWRQVSRLHAANIAHRDLRASNVMINKKGEALIIDFGFAEISASKQRQHMDNAELLMSMAIIVGVPRTVKAATDGIGTEQLERALPYLQTAVFSGATTKLLKGNRQLLQELKDTISHVIDKEDEDIDEADIVRFNRRRIINLCLLAIFVYVVAPQFGVFREAISHAEIASIGWFVPLALASMLTYVLTGITYAALASVPLKIREAALVQLAASFVSKILPGGVGGTTVNAKYLTKAGMDPIETTAIITTQTVIGFAMFILPLGLLLTLNGTNILKLVQLPVSSALLITVIGILGICAAICLIIRKLREMVLRRAADALESVRNISTPPRELALSAITSLGVTAAYVFCLYAALQSVGVHLGASSAILVYATAIIAKSALPVPGGLGPVEAAMIGALLGFGVDKTGAVSSVLIYRLATFWIPIPFSIFAYRYINRRKLI